MIDVDFEVNGHRVEPREMEHGLQQAMLATIREALAEQVGDLECADHHHRPHILCRGPSVVELEMEVCGCCDQVIDAVENRLQ